MRHEIHWALKIRGAGKMKFTGSGNSPSASQESSRKPPNTSEESTRNLNKDYRRLEIIGFPKGWPT